MVIHQGHLLAVLDVTPEDFNLFVNADVFVLFKPPEQHHIEVKILGSGKVLPVLWPHIGHLLMHGVDMCKAVGADSFLVRRNLHMVDVPFLCEPVVTVITIGDKDGILVKPAVEMAYDMATLGITKADWFGEEVATSVLAGEDTDAVPVGAR